MFFFIKINNKKNNTFVAIYIWGLFNSSRVYCLVKIDFCLYLSVHAAASRMQLLSLSLTLAKAHLIFLAQIIHFSHFCRHPSLSTVMLPTPLLFFGRSSITILRREFFGGRPAGVASAGRRCLSLHARNTLCASLKSRLVKETFYFIFSLLSSLPILLLNTYCSLVVGRTNIQKLYYTYYMYAYTQGRGYYTHN